MPAVVIAALWISVGYGMIYFLAALQSVDRELYEAAEVDGAGNWQQFWHVTLPGIRPVLIFLILVGTIGAFQLFELPYVLFHGVWTNYAVTIVMYLSRWASRQGDIGYASADRLDAGADHLRGLADPAPRDGQARGVTCSVDAAGERSTRAIVPDHWHDCDRAAPLHGATSRCVYRAGRPARHRQASLTTPRPILRPAQIALHVDRRSALAILSLLPFFWLDLRHAEDSRRTSSTTRSSPGRPGPLTLDNFHWLFEREPFLHVDVQLALPRLHAHAASSSRSRSLGGFALAKYHFAGKKPLMLIMLATMMLPSQVLLPSSYELMYKIGWLDSYAAMLVPSAVSVFGMFLFMQAMRAVPDELLQAGRVDGCSEFRLWWEVALPIVSR